MCQRVATHGNIYTNGNIYRVSKEKRKTVKDFGSAEDFAIWAWYANRIGVNSFLELYFEQKSVMEGSTLRSPVKNGKDREESIWEMAKSASGTRKPGTPRGTASAARSTSPPRRSFALRANTNSGAERQVASRDIKIYWLAD